MFAYDGLSVLVYVIEKYISNTKLPFLKNN